MIKTPEVVKKDSLGLKPSLNETQDTGRRSGGGRTDKEDTLQKDLQKNEGRPTPSEESSYL